MPLAPFSAAMARRWHTATSSRLPRALNTWPMFMSWRVLPSLIARTCQPSMSFRCSSSLRTLRAASTCSIRCSSCLRSKRVWHRPIAAWRSCLATRIPRRMPVPPRRRSRCTRRRSASPTGPRRTASTLCSCTVVAALWVAAAARQTVPCWRSLRDR